MRPSLYDFCTGHEQTHLLAQWDGERNAPLTPKDVTYGSHQKVWWYCASGHHWQAKIYSRSAGSGCPYCSGRLAEPKKALRMCYPELEPEWDAEKNGPLQFSELTVGSRRLVWWRCAKGHSYRSAVKSRTQGTGCPICAGRIVLPEENSLAAKFPDLLSDWDTEKNSPLLPTQVMPGAHRKVWWRCPKGHSWQASVASRVTSNAGCPFCAGQKVLSGFNDLASLHPQLAEQWDRKKNGALTPEAVSAYSNRRVWWLCDKGHSFCAVIAHRVNKGSDCPYCTNRKVLPGFNDLETKEPVIASQWHPTLNGSFTPQQVTPGSSRKAWWLCENGHAWKSVISSRTGKQRCGCPVCAGRPLSQCTAILAGQPEKPTH